MTAGLWTENLLAYSAQAALLAAAGAALATGLRLRAAEARLAHWRMALLLIVALPLMQPWRAIEGGEAEVRMSSTVVGTAAAEVARGVGIGWREALLGVIGAGVAIRLGVLALGLWRLRAYRRRAVRLETTPAWLRDLSARTGATAEFLVSADVDGPVTFGARRAWVLLPPSFGEMSEGQQQALCCHELVHVRRRDWVWMVGEELARAALWFHPGVWWVVAQIQLAREEAVDREVVLITQAKEDYLEALLAVAAKQSRLDLAPAPLFLKKRHLARRVSSILKEADMSAGRRLRRLAASAGMLAALGVVAAWMLPLRAPAQESGEVAVETGGLKLLHGTRIAYPAAARERGISGDVVVEATLDAKGNVTDARVLSGPEELRKAALTAVMEWHFSTEQALPARAQVTMRFRGAAAGGAQPRMRYPVNKALQRVAYAGLTDAVKGELEAKLAGRVGQVLDGQGWEQVMRDVREVDEHLAVHIGEKGEGAVLTIGMQQQVSADRLRVGGNMQSTKLRQQARPVYPPAAKEARLQGQVRMEAVIGKDGAVMNLKVLSGEPVLAESAMEAVRQWVYEPTLLNGNPVEVITQIDVNYTLAK